MPTAVRSAEAGTSSAPTGKRALIGWVLFDWATQPFYTLVVTFLFAPYFVNGFMADPARGSALWAYATGIAELIAARACARARRHRRREPESQAVDRLLLRAARGRTVRLVACNARPHRPRNSRAARLRPRHHRRRACHRLHQRHDGLARLRQEARHPVGLRLGDRLCRRLDQPGAGRRPPRRRSA